MLDPSSGVRDALLIFQAITVDLGHELILGSMLL